MRLLITAPVFITQQAHLDFAEETLSSIKTSHETKILLVRNRVDNQFTPQYSMLIDKFKAEDVYNDMDNNVSNAWNIGIKYGLENAYDYILVPNLDIILHKDCLDNLIDFANNEGREAVVWTAQEFNNRRTIGSLVINRSKDRLEVMSGGEKHDWEAYDEHPHFSCFMVSRKVVNLLKEREEGTKEPVPGLFDPHYERAYFEDQDYHQRILNAGLKAYKCNSSVFYHYGSRTIKSDTQVEKENSITYEKNRQYFANKWGYDSHNRVPTNEERVQLAYDKPFNKTS